jgi:hypothetical protein
MNRLDEIKLRLAVTERKGEPHPNAAVRADIRWLIDQLEAARMEQWERDKLQAAFDELNSYLLDNTEEVFEEIPEVDRARLLIHDVLNGIEGD